MKIRILSIDAWRDGDGWSWNQWFHVGDVETLPDGNRAIIRMMREAGYLSEQSRGRVTVDDDGFNAVIIDRKSGEPLFAIAYGENDQ